MPGAITQHQTSAVAPEIETVLFWAHLTLTDLIGGIADPRSDPPASELAWGQTHPSAPTGGGFHVKHADGGLTHPLPGWPPLAKQPSGTFLVLQPAVAEDLVPAVSRSQVLDPREAAAIDRKIDDGDPYDGAVVGYGTLSLALTGGGCFTWSAVDAGDYAEGRASKDCGLAFRIAP